MERWISVAVIAAASTLIYLNSLDGGFVFDDHRAILTNDDLDTDKTAAWELFLHDFWGGTMWRKESHKSYRPLTVLTFRYFNHFFSGLDPYSYHLVNILLHSLTCVLFLFVAEVVLMHSKSEWPLLAALLFATHSIHVESVASVVGRAELTSAIFFFLAFLTYVDAVHSSSSVSAVAWVKVLSTVLLAACSMLCKEQGITVLALCACYDVLKHWPFIWAFESSYNTIQNGSVKVKENGVWLKQNMHQLSHMSRRIGTLVILGMLLMWFRMSMNFGSEPIFKPEEMRAAFHEDRVVRILSFSNIYVWNVWLMFAPSPLCCDWSLGTLPLVTTVHDIRNIYSVVFYAVLAILLFRILKSENDRVTVGLSLSFLIVPFIPSSGILIRVGFVIAERVLFLPSSGICLLVVVGARKLSHSIKQKKVVQLALVYVTLIMAIKTISRNPDWQSDLSLFESGARVNPNNVKMLNNYGMELKSASRFEESRQQYLKAIEVEPDYAEIYFNYANLLSEMKDHEGAAEYFEKAITYPQMYSKTLNNLATTYFRLGRLKEAEEKFLESLKVNPDQSMTYNNLASLYGESNRYKESEAMFKKSLAMNPNYVEAYFNLGTLLYKMGKEEEAEKNLRYALKLNPLHHGALNNLQVIQYYKDKQQQQQH